MELGTAQGGASPSNPRREAVANALWTHHILTEGPPSHQNVLFCITFFVCLQIWGSVQHKGVQVLATLDEKLEQTPLLQELDPNEMPDEVTDSNGNITQDCSEVWVWL